jgi:tRNA nucleotidyltransferase/poly(A) polymerase
MTTDILYQWPTDLFLVGGHVRDTLLGIEAKDRDVCSSLLPEEVLAFCQANGIKATLTNESHLVVTLWLDNEPIEHTTFRSESDCDGVHTKAIASTQKEDANRRDFSINALYMPWGTNQVIDFVDGLSDLNNKVLRLISSEEYGGEFQRLWEHGGRLFRLARFLVKLKDWTLDLNTLEAARRFSPLVFKEHRGKRESFQEEWVKSNYSWNYLEALNTFGFLEAHGLSLPNPFSYSSIYPWYSLWVASGRPNLNTFQDDWKISKEDILIIKDLELGLKVEHEYQWVTTKFRRLSPEQVASYYNQSFRKLSVPTQGDIALEIGSGPRVLPVWVDRIKTIYKG